MYAAHKTVLSAHYITINVSCHVPKDKWLIELKPTLRTHGWPSQLSVQLLILAQVLISRCVGLNPALDSGLSRAKPAWDSLSPSPCPSYPLPSINKLKNKQKTYGAMTPQIFGFHIHDSESLAVTCLEIFNIE